MKKDEPVKKILKIARNREEKAAALVERVRHKLDIEKKRMSVLDNYYSEYVAKQYQGTQAVNPMLVRNYAEFLMQIQNTIEKQRVQLNKIEIEFQSALKNWQMMNNRVDGINKVLEQFEKEAIAMQNKMEQILLDEWVGQKQSRDNNV